MPWIEEPSSAKGSAPSNKWLKFRSRVSPSAAIGDQPCSSQTANSRRNDAPIDGNLDDADDQPKDDTPMRTFVDKVSIAGLPEAYSAEFVPDRIMFCVAILFSSIIIVHQSYGVIQQYILLDGTPMYYDAVMVAREAPFPNITISHHAFNLNTTRLRNWMRFSNQTERLARSPLLWKTFYDIWWFGNLSDTSLTLDTAKEYILWYINEVFDWGVHWAELGDLRYELARHAYRDAALEAEKEGDSIYDIFLVQCEESICDCSYYGQPFDCCDFVLTNQMSMMTFYHFDVQRLAQRHFTSFSTNIGDFSSKGLTFTIRSDWLTQQMDQYGLTDDAFDLYINEIPSFFVTAAPIPANMDVVVQLNEPVMVAESTDCITDGSQKLQHYSYYDDLGTHCKHDILLNLQMKYLDCMIPAGSNDVANYTCMFEQLYLISLGLDQGGQEPAAESGSAPKARSKRSSTESGALEIQSQTGSMSTLEKDFFETLSLVTGKHTPCKPLCSRWMYPVLSTSFAEIRYASEDLKPANTSWSRVTVIMPDSSKTHFEESRKSAYYLATCDISGIMGVYLGFSMVTIVQLLAYGSFVIISELLKVRERFGTRTNEACNQGDGTRQNVREIRRVIGDRRKSYVDSVIVTEL